MSVNTKLHVGLFLFLFVIVISIYANSLNVPFIFDDEKNISHVEAIHISDLKFNTLRNVVTEARLPTRLVANISFAINFYFDKLNVYSYHVVNILIHFINGILVYFLARLILQRHPIKDDRVISPVFLIAAFAAGIFIAHPIQTQSVTYIVQRMNSMATLFYLLSLCVYIVARQIDGTKWLKIVLYITAIFSWFLSLGCKEIAVLLPITILMFEWYFFRNLEWSWLKQNLPFMLFAVLLIVSSAYFYLGGSPITTIQEGYNARDFTMYERLLTQSRVIVFYLGLFILPLPSRLNLIHEFPISSSLFDPVTTAIAIIFHILVLGIAILYARKYRLISFCILWFYLHLSIESTLIPLEIIFEHRLYLPMAGLAIASAYLLINALINYKNTTGIVCMLIIFLLGMGTHIRNETWKSTELMWRDVINKNPASHRAHYNLATELSKKGRVGESFIHFKRAIRLKPDHANAHINFANALKKIGDLDNAIRHYTIASHITPDNFLLHYNMAHALSLDGKYNDAINSYKKSISLVPDYSPTHYNIAEIYGVLNEFKLARAHFYKSIEYDPSLADAFVQIGVIDAKQGNYDSAVIHFNKALNIRKDHQFANINLVKAYILKNDIDAPCKIFKRKNNIASDIQLKKILTDKCD